MTRMAISPRLATRRLRIPCEVAGFTLRSAVAVFGSPRARVRAGGRPLSIITLRGNDVAPETARAPVFGPHRAGSRQRAAPAGDRHPRRRGCDRPGEDDPGARGLLPRGAGGGARWRLRDPRARRPEAGCGW